MNGLRCIAALCLAASLSGCALTPGGRAVKQWYHNEWARDGECLKYCIKRDGIQASGTVCEGPSCLHPCECYLPPL